MTAADKYGYTYLDADIGLGQVASRFGTTARDVWIATASEPGKAHNLSFGDFIEGLNVGDSLLIPYAGDPWQWRMVTPKVGSLAEFCAQKPEPARAGGPALTPAAVWYHIRNEATRGAILKRLPSLDARRALDTDPGSANLTADDRLFVPFPERDKAPAIRAAPAKGGAPSAVVESTPEWVSSLVAIDKEVSRLIGLIRTASRPCLALQKQGQLVCHLFATLDRLVALMIEREPIERSSTRPATDAQLKALQNTFASLIVHASDLLYVDPAGKLQTPEAAQWQSLSEALSKIVNGDRLKDLSLKAAKAPREKVAGMRVTELADRIHERGLRTLAESPLADTARKAIEEAYALLPGGSATGSQNLTTVVGAYVAAKTTAVGNTPGPSSLSVAVVELYQRWKMPQLAGPIEAYARAVQAAKAAGATQSAQAAAALKDATALKDVALQAQDKMAKAAGLTAAETEQLAGFLNLGTKSGCEQAAALIASKTQASGPWSGLIGYMNIIALYLAVTSARSSTDPLSCADVLNIVGASAGSASAAMAIVISLRPDGALGKAFSAAGPFVGGLATFTGIITGAITAYTDPTVLGTASGVTQLVGGVASLGGFLLGVPGLQLLGTSLLVVSVGLAVWPVLKAMTAPGAKKVILAQLQSLRESKDDKGDDRPITVFWKQITAKFPYLASDLAALESALNADDHGGLFVLHKSPEMMERLKALGFSLEDATEMVDKMPLPVSPLLPLFPTHGQAF